MSYKHSLLVMLRLALGFGLGTVPWAVAGETPIPGRPEMDQAVRDWLDSAGSEAFGKWLKQTLEQQPDQPEWVAMLTHILQGGELGPTGGWFPKAVARTRYDWKYLSTHYDRDNDGTIGRAEFPGAHADFERLDPDSSGTITQTDLEWPDHALARSPGSALFRTADANSDGHLTRDEWVGLFEKADRDHAGYLSLDDLRAKLPNPRAKTNAPGVDGLSKSVLVRSLFRQELGSLQPGFSVDAVPADFTLTTADGKHEITLSQLTGSKPVVLVFGSITCGPFRSQAGNIEKIYRRYRGRAHFLMVYVCEAHPTDGWHSSSPDTAEFDFEQPKTYEARTAVAQTCQRKLSFEMPLVVDKPDDAVGSVYSGMPSRLYVIDRGGKVSYRSGRGPYGFKPAEMEQSLVWALTEGSPIAQAGTNVSLQPKGSENSAVSKQSAPPR